MPKRPRETLTYIVCHNLITNSYKSHMTDEKHHLRRRIDHEWQQMTASDAWKLCADLYEERDLKELLHSKFLDDVENAEEEELEFLVSTLESAKDKKA